MKKKLLAVVVAALLVTSLLPALAFAEPAQASGQVTGLRVNGMELQSDGNGALQNASGLGWSYASSKLTLENYDASAIVLMPSTQGEILTIELVGKNTLHLDAGDTEGIRTVGGGSIVFQGTGTLDIVGYTLQNPIQVENGTLTFNLGAGGVVRIAPTPGIPQRSLPNDEAKVAMIPTTVAAISVFDQGMGMGPTDPPMTATLDKIVLKPGNTITAPTGGFVALQSFGPWPPEAVMLSETEEGTPVEPVATANAEFAFATIKATADGLPATAVTITGSATPNTDPTTPTTPGSTTPSNNATPTKTPKTGDSGFAGIMMLLMVTGAITAVGLGKRKFD